MTNIFSPKQLTAIFILLLLLSGMVVGTYFGFAVRFPGANDFYPRWRGAQLFWLEGVDPYSEEATEAIQRGMYGRLALPTEDQALFVYPFYVVFALLPLVGLSYAWVQAIWMVLLMVCLVAGTLLILQVLEWMPPLWITAVLLLWSLIFYSSARTILLGQFAGVVFVCLMGCLLLLKRGHDGWAGVLLALSTFKPQMVFLLIPALMIWGIGQRRWRFVTSFVGTMAGLAGLSFLLEPGWLLSFVDQVLAYPGYTVIGNPVQIVTTYVVPIGGTAVNLIIWLLLLAWMVWWWRLLGGTAVDSPHFLYIISITLVVTHLVAPETATTNYVALYLPLFWGLKWLAQQKLGNLWLILFLIGSFILMWILFFGSVKGDAESWLLFLPLPFGLLLMLLAGKEIFLKKNS